MDREEREALAMTREELLALAATAKPARFARKMPRRLRRRRERSHLGAAIAGWFSRAKGRT
jgi:hypothetical protein